MDSPENAEMRQEIYVKVRDAFGIGDGETTVNESSDDDNSTDSETETFNLAADDDLTDEPIV